MANDWPMHESYWPAESAQLSYEVVCFEARETFAADLLEAGQQDLKHSDPHAYLH